MKNNLEHLKEITERLIEVENEREELLESLRQGQNLTQVKIEILRIFALTPCEEEMYPEVLDIILKALNSEYGTFGYLTQDELIVPSMTRHIWDKCQVSNKTIRFSRKTLGKTSWCRAITEKRSICSNKVSNVPKGHIQIRRHISVPILHKEETIGLLQVANKQDDYTEHDVRLLEVIAELIAPYLDAKLKGKKANGT